MKKYYLLAFSAFFLINSNAQPDLQTTVFATGFNRPINITNAGDDRLFIVEQGGVIRILNSDGTTNTTPFLDIQSSVIDIVGLGDERGLLGLVFHPNYSSNGFFYLNYINNAGNTQISRFSVSADPDIAGTTETPILSITQPEPNHNGGHMAFGSDGFLYIASGDGGSQSDPNDLGQSLDTLLGKLLRIDVDGGSPYAIPSSNPFENDGDPNTLGEIWAYGLRNPWKFSFDPMTDDLWIGDVGQDVWEEINLVPMADDGLNYGWRCYEGNNAFNLTGCPDMSTLTFPVAAYSHFDGIFKCSVIGGYRYRGSAFPGFDGLYFFADFCSGEVGYLEFNGSSWDLALESVSGNSWSAFGEDVNGELFLADMDSGIIYELSDNNLSLNDSEIDGFKMYPNPASNVLNIEMISDEGFDIIIYNTSGQAVYQDKFNGLHLETVSLNQMSSGFYFVKVNTTDSKTFIKKLIIQ